MKCRMSGVLVTLILGVLLAPLASDAQWKKVPMVTVSATATDPRLPLPRRPSSSGTDSWPKSYTIQIRCGDADDGTRVRFISGTT